MNKWLSAIVLAWASAVLPNAGRSGTGQEPQPRPQPQSAVPQGPAPVRPAPPPAGAAPLAPVDEPYVAPVLRQDLRQRYEVPDMLEGFYELRGRTTAGVSDLLPGIGWLVIGKRHLAVYLQSPGDRPDVPRLNAGVRRWQRTADGNLQLTVLAGHFNKADGDVVVESPGTVEMRRLELTNTSIRVYQNDNSFLEFVRIE